MNNLRPVKLQDSAVKTRPSRWTSRKVAIGLFVTLIVAVMIAWLGFLGWGMLELLWAVAAWIKKLWAALP